MTEQFLFSGDTAEELEPPSREPFHVLIVDDDKEVHVITQMALSDISFAGAKIQFHSAYSAKEAKIKLQDYPYFALILLDVVMETEHSGLELARWIRQELQNHTIRIVLRTGQPGHAPEEEIIASYDIDDYKEKTELTYRKLVTLMYSSLRSFASLQRMTHYQQRAEEITQTSTHLYSIDQREQFFQTVLEQFIHYFTLHQAGTAHSKTLQAYLATGETGGLFTIKYATPDFQKHIGKPVRPELNQKIEDYLRMHNKPSGHLKYHDACLSYYRTTRGQVHVVCMEGTGELSTTDQHLLQFLIDSIALAIEHTGL